MSDTKFRSGDFWLCEPDAKYKTYGIGWIDKSKRQTRRIAISATDRDDAKRQVREHDLKNGLGQQLKDEPLLTACNRYYLQYGIKLPSAPTFLIAMKKAMEVFGEDPPMVSEMGKANQEKIIATWRESGNKDSYINRLLGSLWAAMNYAAENNHIQAAVIPKRIAAKRWGAKFKGRKLVLTIPQLGKLFDAACSITRELPKFTLLPPNAKYKTYRLMWYDAALDHSQRYSLWTTDPTEAEARANDFVTQYAKDHPVTSTMEYGTEWRYLILLVGTGSRPQALCELSKDTQVDFEHGTIDLNPPGREQTKKFRPIIPMAPTLRMWMEKFDTVTKRGHVMGSLGRPLGQGGRCLFRMIARKAGIKATSYTIRHTVATWLASRVDSPWERDQFMGWQRSDGASAMGATYNHYDPRYLRECALQIQALFEAIAPHTLGDLLQRGFADQPQPLDDRQNEWLDQFLFNDGHRLVGLFTPQAPPERAPVLVENPTEANPTTAWQMRCKHLSARSKTDV